MTLRLVIVQNRATQFDMPLYARIQQSGDWDLLVIYTDADEKNAVDGELGHAPCWDHVPAAADRGVYLAEHERRDVTALTKRIAAHCPDLVVLCGYYPRLHARLVGRLKRRGLKIGLRSDNTLLHSQFEGWRGIAKRLLLPFWLSRYDRKALLASIPARIAAPGWKVPEPEAPLDITGQQNTSLT